MICLSFFVAKQFFPDFFTPTRFFSTIYLECFFRWCTYCTELLSVLSSLHWAKSTAKIVWNSHNISRISQELLDISDFKAETGALSGICHRPQEMDTVDVITRRCARIRRHFFSCTAAPIFLACRHLFFLTAVWHYCRPFLVAIIFQVECSVLCLFNLPVFFMKHFTLCPWL